jgi:hypothetical protein
MRAGDRCRFRPGVALELGPDAGKAVRRGRPVTTGKGTLIGVRLLDEPLATLDQWIARQKDAELTRPEAIRRLVELGLKAKK